MEVKHKSGGRCADGFPFLFFGFSKSAHCSAFASSLASFLTCYGQCGGSIVNKMQLGADEMECV